jgi:CRISPR-associated protein Csd1
MALSTTDTTQGYLLGRLFSVLETAEEVAAGGYNLTIRDRYYSVASSTPSAVFPHLMRLKNYHLAMMADQGQAAYVETLIAEILAELREFPAHLCLQDQGRFAVGYYHQRQSSVNRKEHLKISRGTPSDSPRYLRL